ncbi:xylulokinase [Massilia yuzhufengensis]|uniref:Xylulose kinase n=1 Tax=Massilia yuzhufengensis TaxID=1164594 RepID=A0A1I1N050_9BURK|nr:xylulokinase [Massilia yuzhufengensis]SFC90726.1 xylulokinase [Massilia yuzhufengensis]
MYLGIDLGTSEVKLLLMGEAGDVVATAGAPLTVSRPQPKWSEQDPAQWWAATRAAMRELRAAHPAALSRVRAIGLSGQMHGAVLLDAQDRVLRPAILWNDGRSHAECTLLTEREPRLPAITGNLAMPGFTAPKLAWVARHEPDVFGQVATVLLPKDYLRLLLTGDKVSEMSDAAGTLWLDVARRDWSDAMLDATGLARSQMPRLVEGSAPSGGLLPALAAEWGMPPGVIVAGGGGDNAASAVGIGATRPGEGFISLGTSGVLFVVTDQLRANPDSAVHAFCHALPGRWHQMSVMLSAASCLSWVTRATGAGHEAALLPEARDLSSAQQQAAPLFLPYLSGERTPHNDPHAQGVFFGLGHDTSRGALAYSVLEGVAFGMADGLAALRAAGTEAGTLSLVGGGARSPYWSQLLADTLALPIVTHAEGSAGAALGAARLAALADGQPEEQACAPLAVVQRFEPEFERHGALMQRYRRYQALYGQLRSLFQQAAPA